MHITNKDFPMYTNVRDVIFNYTTEFDEENGNDNFNFTMDIAVKTDMDQDDAVKQIQENLSHLFTRMKYSEDTGESYQQKLGVTSELDQVYLYEESDSGLNSFYVSLNFKTDSKEYFDKAVGTLWDIDPEAWTYTDTAISWGLELSRAWFKYQAFLSVTDYFDTYVLPEDQVVELVDSIGGY